ncbi:hypothetical protein LCGC14_1069360 [marine sediment metagenome]|uniref:Uncharacterized protein n=1 Tax=marine sediment metagenome TaxID=412755 RepID=A0A0F9MNL8_9ZZZZ
MSLKLIERDLRIALTKIHRLEANVVSLEKYIYDLRNQFVELEIKVMGKHDVL